MKRSFDATFINEVLNHESVRDWAEVKGYGDLTALVSDPKNVLLTNECGGFIYVQVAHGTYEVHTQFLPEGRGAKALKYAYESIRYMFIHTDCVRIISKAKPENVGACQLAKRVLGYKGFNGNYNYYSLHYMDWVETDKTCKAEGEEFHKLVEDVTNHDDDDTHDCHVGAALLIAKAGNPEKAIQVYNYWALAACYAPAIINNLHPLLISVGDMNLQITNIVEVI